MELSVNKIAPIRIRRLLLRAPEGPVKQQNHTLVLVTFAYRDVLVNLKVREENVGQCLL